MGAKRLDKAALALGVGPGEECFPFRPAGGEIFIFMVNEHVGNNIIIKCISR